MKNASYILYTKTSAGFIFEFFAQQVRLCAQQITLRDDCATFRGEQIMLRDERVTFLGHQITLRDERATLLAHQITLRDDRVTQKSALKQLYKIAKVLKINNKLKINLNPQKQ